jgi:glucosamine--fructose-6-phosphate aminotransferase (isomerizing)
MIADFIREQPEVVVRCLARARQFLLPEASNGIHGIALVGSGSSLNALQTVRSRFVTARRGPVLVYEPQDFIEELAHGALARSLVLVLSQSGASVTSVAALEASQDAGLQSLAITASAASPLGSRARHVFEMPVGDEPVGPKTKGFLSSLATLHALAEGLGAPPAGPVSAGDLRAQIEPSREAAYTLAAMLSDVDMITIAGRGANYGVALEASLKIAEMAGIPTAAFPTEELLHGRLHGVTPASLVMMICSGLAEIAEAEAVRAAMERHGCRVQIVNAAGQGWPGRAPGLPVPWDSLALTVPFQWLAVALAEARGLRPEAMRYGALSRDLAIKL